jgi:tungstate transport system permease protein
MQYLFESIGKAISLIVQCDAELALIVWFTLKIALISTLTASLAGIPAGFAIYLSEFKFRRVLITVLNSLLAVPTVVIALLVYACLSRRGMFGSFNLLYTQSAIVIGQTILVIPMVATFVLSALSHLDIRYRKTAMTLGADRLQVARLLLHEAKFGVAAAIAAAFGRVISEIGISMMLGGNIKGVTRTMTTAMAIEYDKGEFVLAVALGMILMTITLGINILINYFQGNINERYG